MDYAAIANEVRDLLDLSEPMDLDTDRLKRAVNWAYGQVVVKVEKYAGPAFNLAATVPILTVPSTPLREYDLYASTDVSSHPDDVRRIADCTRVDPNDDDDRHPVPIVSWVLRRDRLGRPESGRSSRVSDDSVYFYRRSTGAWILGFVNPTVSDGWLYEVSYVPDVGALVGTSDVPIMVPSSWHSLIALKAAIRLIGHEHRDASDLLGQYVEGLSDMRADLEAGIPSAGVQMV